MPLSARKIVVIVSGGIAAYKSADLVSRLRKAGAQVRVVLTHSARQFVTPLTFETLSGHPVYTELFERTQSWEMEHIAWARWADGVVVAPATAHLLARMALGLADDAATTLLLAYQGPVWVAPAMNTAMLTHPATEQNMATLGSRGIRFIEAEPGLLACGEMGAGRMAEPETIVRIIAAALSQLPPSPGSPAGEPTQSLAGKRVLVTAGPTREMLDPIRFISNRSTGRMGTALAAEALTRGAEVLLVHGPMTVPAPDGARPERVDSAQEMLAAVKRAWDGIDIAVFAAAVANYESAQSAGQKIKGGETLTLALRRTPDIAAWAGAHKRAGQVLVGFAAESENLLAAAEGKLRAKELDLICANAIGQEGVGFEESRNEVTLLTRDGGRLDSPRETKERVAAWIWDQIEQWTRGQ
jgi:phosphopantothenoylcysteine decarboxylase/phosphopantothenate--cysteine ligase